MHDLQTFNALFVFASTVSAAVMLIAGYLVSKRNLSTHVIADQSAAIQAIETLANSYKERVEELEEEVRGLKDKVAALERERRDLERLNLRLQKKIEELESKLS